MSGAARLSARRRGVDAGIPLFALGFVALYALLVPGLVEDWSRGGDFSHGFVVPPLVVWLLVARRDRWHEIRKRPFLPGAFVLVAAAMQYLAGVAGAEVYLQRTSMIPFVLGWTLLLWGPAAARHVLGPTLFLLFMLPPPVLIWNTVAFPLQLFASRIAEGLLVVIGIPAIRSGNVIELSNCSLEVAAACSGLRSLVTLLFVAAIFAEGSLAPGDRPRSLLLRAVLVIAAVPIAVAANSLRVALSAVAVTRFGPAAVEGIVHDVSGALLFLLALAALFAGRGFLGWIESRRFG